MSDISLLVHVYGRVQGVGYRQWALRVAESLNLRGWVSNLPDGRVELLVQGDQTVVEAFLAQLREGPSRSDVSQVEHKTLEIDPTLQRFEIRH